MLHSQETGLDEVNYLQIQKELACGWNTWNTWSVLSHVLLPEGLAVNLSVKEYKSGRWLREAQIGRQGENEEKIQPGPHAYDGSYTELTLHWQDISLRIQSAHAGKNDLVLLVTPLKMQKRAARLMADVGFLWNRPGAVYCTEEGITAQTNGKRICLYATKKDADEVSVASMTPRMTMELTEPVGLSSGRARGVEEIREIIEAAREKLEAERKEKYGEYYELHAAMQTCLAWDTIYEPQGRRVMTTVSRIWNAYWGGYILFDWDTYFAARMIALDSRELAYANAAEVTREARELGFVPNNYTSIGVISRDRSQPPVGSWIVYELYLKYRDKWFLEEMFDDLLSWNRWYFEHRHVGEGMMAYGSDPFEPVTGNYWEVNGVNDTFGAALESGLDNSPMYDDVPFDKERHVACLADVGLTGLYARDCRALMEIAKALGREEEKELQERYALCSGGIQKMWDEEKGFFYNLRTDTGEFSRRISPTNFYALFADGVRADQIQRVIKEHLLNEEEFWGEWVLPSIARNDPAYEDQDYWRGRIWAPLNFIAYTAFRDLGRVDVCRMLAEKSAALLLKGWREHGWVCENYDADTGSGEARVRYVDGKQVSYGNSDRFYSWGGLLAYIRLQQAGMTR